MKIRKGLKESYKLATSYGIKYDLPTVRRSNEAGMIVSICGVILLVMFLIASCAHAEDVDIDRMADAIYHAEGGAKTKHPYGILKKYKTTTPRQACINTIKTNIKKFNNQNKEKDFIVFMSKTYCPIGAENDPTGLNKNWVKNVKYFYNKETK